MASGERPGKRNGSRERAISDRRSANRERIGISGDGARLIRFDGFAGDERSGGTGGEIRSTGTLSDIERMQNTTLQD